nr:transposase [Thiorhodococcus mannitoliphagus]
MRPLAVAGKEPGGRVDSDSQRARREPPGPATRRRIVKTYSEEFKASIIVKLLPPHDARVPALAREYGIPRDTLYSWRRQAGGQGALPATPCASVGVLSGAEKFAVVVETATLNELDLGAYCRRKGLFAEQIAAWRTSCQRANDPQPRAGDRAEQRAEREQIKQLSQELLRKDKALAEAAALLLLQKKVQGLWAESADARSPSRGASK